MTAVNSSAIPHYKTVTLYSNLINFINFLEKVMLRYIVLGLLVLQGLKLRVIYKSWVMLRKFSKLANSPLKYHDIADAIGLSHRHSH